MEEMQEERDEYLSRKTGKIRKRDRKSVV